MNESDGCVRVCAEIVGGQLTPSDRVSFSFTTESNTAVGMLDCYFVGWSMSTIFQMACIFLLIDVLDFLPPPEIAVLTFREGNMGRPLCKDIIIVSDNITEGLEDFDVELAIESEVGVGVQFNPINTTVKITEVFNPSIEIANAAQATAESAAQTAASAISFINPSIIVANAAQATAESAAEATASANAGTYCTTTWLGMA